jgi:hypothetical protein
MLRHLLGLACLVGSALPAAAIVGGEAAPDLAPHVVEIVSRNAFCSAVVLAPSLLLTAGHCVADPTEYRALTLSGGTPVLHPVATIALHPKFDPRAYKARKFVIDLALVKLAEPLPSSFQPLPLPARGEEGVMGARYRIAGFGLAARGDGRTGGTLRSAELVGVPLQSDIQLRLADPDKRALGACQGDSGGLALRLSEADGRPVEPAFVGILGSARGLDDRGCGGFTGVALIGTALDWIRGTASRLGVTLP